ncbi:DUF6480 family protein [Amycolatopsis sp. cmx-4-54]|uniref:DUF6480 family protein n=1 Tax=Amycolatopsis sp. cmx-4-54 TaxID=2790936 RepID=UPI00397B5549
MTAPGPEPDDVPGLEPGGSVSPWDVPPDAGQTSGLSHPQPIPSRVPGSSRTSCSASWCWASPRSSFYGQ